MKSVTHTHTQTTQNGEWLERFSISKIVLLKYSYKRTCTPPTTYMTIILYKEFQKWPMSLFKEFPHDFSIS